MNQTARGFSPTHELFTPREEEAGKEGGGGGGRGETDRQTDRKRQKNRQTETNSD